MTLKHEASGCRMEVEDVAFLPVALPRKFRRHQMGATVRFSPGLRNLHSELSDALMFKRWRIQNKQKKNKQDEPTNPNALRRHVENKTNGTSYASPAPNVSRFVAPSCVMSCLVV